MVIPDSKIQSFKSKTPISFSLSSPIHEKGSSKDLFGLRFNSLCTDIFSAAALLPTRNFCEAAGKTGLPPQSPLVEDFLLPYVSKSH